MKTTKIAAGYYLFDYKGFDVKITKLDYPDYLWYFELNDGQANDYHSTKKIAVEAAIEYIDYITKKVKPCGGCGNEIEQNRCLGCLHSF